MAPIIDDGFMLLVLVAAYGYAFYWMFKLLHLIITMRSESKMGPYCPGDPPCWDKKGCLTCWLFCECYCGKSEKYGDMSRENKRRARIAAESLTQDQIVAIFRQGRKWTKGDKVWPIPDAEIEQDGFICEGCWALDFCKNSSVKRYRKHLKKLKKKGEAVAKKKGEANLEKAKSRFRGAAWWFFGGVLGLIAGKFFVDAAMYFGMPAVPGAGPMKVWTIAMWSVLMGGFVCIFGAFWMGLTIIRKKFKLRTSYDVTMGDVRIVKVDPELAQNLLPYEPVDETKRIELADATAEVMASAQEAENG